MTWDQYKKHLLETDNPAWSEHIRVCIMHSEGKVYVTDILSRLQWKFRYITFGTTVTVGSLTIT